MPSAANSGRDESADSETQSLHSHGTVPINLLLIKERITEIRNNQGLFCSDLCECWKDSSLTFMNITNFIIQ